MMDSKKYQDALNKFHKESGRHILVIETNMPFSDAQQVFALSDRVRKAGNEMVAIMRRNYSQLMRTKKYRKLLKLYGRTKDKGLKKSYAKQLSEMQSSYNVTWDACRKAMISIAKKYSVLAVFGLTKAEDVWRGVEKCLYDNGKTIHFSKFGDYPVLRAKQIDRAVPISFKDGKLVGKVGKIKSVR